MEQLVAFLTVDFSHDGTVVMASFVVVALLLVLYVFLASMHIIDGDYLLKLIQVLTCAYHGHFPNEKDHLSDDQEV